MQVSARNVFTGTLTAVVNGAVNAEVTIDAQGLQVVAMITQESTENLGLAVGKTATALFKASQVVLAVLP